MKIFLTGHEGYIGSHLDWALSARYGSDSVYRFSGDRSSLGAWEADLVKEVPIISVDTVIHCGAKSKTDVGSNEAFLWNYRATQFLAKNLIGKCKQFIYFSSCAALEPVGTPYAWSKRAAGDWLMENASQKACVLVPYNVFGDEVGRRRSDFSIPAKIVRRELPFVYNPWKRDYIHIQDLVKMVLYAVENGLRGQSRELGTGTGFEVFELCKAMEYDAERRLFSHETYPAWGFPPRIAHRDRILPGVDKFISVIDWMKGS